MDKNHPAYEQFQKWVRDNGLDREGIDLSVFWSCWLAGRESVGIVPFKVVSEWVGWDHA